MIKHKRAEYTGAAIFISSGGSCILKCLTQRVSNQWCYDGSDEENNAALSHWLS